MKIVSLVPSITETLFDVGLDVEQIVGRTKFCIHPGKLVNDVEVIGGTKNLNLEKIKSINPDLIIANREENEKSQVEELMRDFNVWVTDIETLEDNSKFLIELGKKFNREKETEKFAAEINQMFDVIAPVSNIKVAYLIWKNPYMTVGFDTFIHSVIEKLGFHNIFENQKRYPEVSIEQLKLADVIFLSSEPFPFSGKHILELKKELPESEILLVDGEAFSWYGTHIVKCKSYYKELVERFL